MPPKDYIPPKFCIELSDGTYQEIDNIHNVTVEQIEAVCERYELIRVTRCKDCKYYAIAQLKKNYTPDERYKPSVCIKGEFAVSRPPEWYCADGERRDETEMKHIAIFDIPDDYAIGCAAAKIAPKGKDLYTDSDFEDAYAQVEPLSKEKAEVLERFNAVERVIQDLNIGCCYDMPGFWIKNGNDYKVIPTKFHKGYMKALEDVDKAIRSRFGFAEREEIFMPMFTSDGKEEREE